MTTIGASEVKAHFTELLARVTKGEDITITRHRKPVAKLIPFAAPQKRDRTKVIKDLLEFGKERKLEGQSIRDLIQDGRRMA